MLGTDYFQLQKVLSFTKWFAHMHQKELPEASKEENLMTHYEFSEYKMKKLSAIT